MAAQPANPQVDQFVRNIREKLPVYGTPEKCSAVLKDEIRGIMPTGTLDPAMEYNIDAACEKVRASIEDVEILRPCSLIKPRDDWYTGPSATDLHWPALEGYLRNEKEWDGSTVDSIDSTSSEIISLLDNPSKTQFRCRGLVVGYVQSGKTANMTAVIAKAVDSGYNLIVVLAGMTNKLRAQTQRRFQEDVLNRHRHLWQLYTTVEDDGDFVVPPNGSFTMPVEGRAQLAVIKKITSRLEAFHRAIVESPEAIRKELKVLLIDDECDQASVNSAKKDYDMTAINEAIRKIIRSLPAVSYVGYTATPFANVFINPYPPNQAVLDDLYPEDFITSLPQPEAYFGPKEVFGAEPVDAENETEEEAGRDMIRLISESELSQIIPDKASEKESFQPSVTASMEEAIRWFFGTCAIRLKRGQNKHMTMLVHTSPFVAQHRNMACAIKGFLKRLRKESLDELFRVMNSEFGRVPGDEDHLQPPPETLKNEILDSLNRVEVVVENGESELRLDYTGEPKIYIVVGGAVLARGLTLEGLCVSYFLRTSRQYDTLLQMGRWFGYRHGYEDLPRLWTTEDLASSFRALARIESEIRQDIARYKEEKITPTQFAVRVRSIPGMAITSASKMRHAYRTNINYFGRHVQTIRFDHHNDEVVAGNWKAAVALINQVGAKNFTRSASGLLAKGAPREAVRKFFSNFDISNQHMDLRKDLVLGFIDNESDQWTDWNVAIIQPAGKEHSLKPLGDLGEVKTVNRSRMKDLANGHADIKALMSKADILIDTEERPEKISSLSWGDLKSHRDKDTPLLLLYPISSKSAAKAGSKVRVDLEAVGDLIGIGIVFPGQADRAGEFYAVELDGGTPEQLDEEEVVDEEEFVELINDSPV